MELTFTQTASFGPKDAPKFIFQKGTKANLVLNEEGQAACSSLRLTVNGVKVRMSWQVAHKYFAEFEPMPSMAALERMSNDGLCETPTGETVEPDGYDEHGCPSWLMICGLM